MRNRFRLSGVFILTAGLVAATPFITAQDAAPAGQGITGPIFVAQMRRNSDVENNLSKAALKKSKNDDVKKLAQETIAQNRKNEMALTSAVSGDPNMSSLPYEGIPDITKEAQKKMKTATGAEFDQIYLVQMKNYFQDDQRTIEAAQGMKNENLEHVLEQLKKSADDGLARVTEVGQSENFKLDQ